MLEKEIEKILVAEIARVGGRAYKFVSPVRRKLEREGGFLVYLAFWIVEFPKRYRAAISRFVFVHRVVAVI